MYILSIYYASECLRPGYDISGTNFAFNQCDESLPTCLNCSTAERSCSYVNNPPPFIVMASDCKHGTTTTPTPGISNVAATSDKHSPSLSSEEDVGGTSLNMDHMELFYHMMTETCNSLGVEDAQNELYSRSSINYGLQAPYLMHELLAFSALHLSILRRARREFYRRQAMLLQTRAISLFNEAIVNNAEVTADNCVPMFLFSSLLGMHLLCDALRYPGDDFDAFLDRFVEYVSLHRGVRTVTSRMWSVLRETEFKPLLRAAEVAMTPPPPPPPPPASPSETEDARCSCGHENQLNSLLSLIDESSSAMDPPSLEACRQAIDKLAVLFHAQRARPSKTSPSTPHGSDVGGIFAWPILLPVEYTALLAQRRPEALIILAHFAVLLHYHRDKWIFGDGGRTMVRFIMAYLGRGRGTGRERWERWLVWPRSIVMGDL